MTCDVAGLGFTTGLGCATLLSSQLPRTWFLCHAQSIDIYVQIYVQIYSNKTVSIQKGYGQMDDEIDAING
jgi:hypothetical protein